MHLFFPLVSDIDEAQRVRVRVRHTSEQGGNDGAASSAVLGRNTLTPVDRLVMMMMIWAFRRMGRIYSTSKKEETIGKVKMYREEKNINRWLVTQWVWNLWISTETFEILQYCCPASIFYLSIWSKWSSRSFFTVLHSLFMSSLSFTYLLC